MAHSAIREQMGGSYAHTLTGNFALGAPRGPGCARLWLLSASTGGYVVTLPAASVVPGMRILVACQGPQGFDVTDGDALTVSLSAGELAQCTYTSVGWLVSVRSYSATAPAAIVGRVPFDFIEVTRGTSDFVLSDALLARGWDGVSPVAARWTLLPSAWLGQHTASTNAAFDTGILPAGSTLLMRVGVGSLVSGKGGPGGRGGDSGVGLLAQAGGAGGTAIRIRGVTTYLINDGVIQGGGGGGGGGSAVAGLGGGGGGGGSGFHLAAGGSGGNPTLAAGSYGGVEIGGVGGGTGATAGGQGGAPGAAGNSAGAAGGAGGLAIVGTSTLTILRTGTIRGSTSP